MKRTLLKHIVSALEAKERCVSANNEEWTTKWDALIDNCEQLLPRGSGFDSGTKIIKMSAAGNLLLFTSFHHMNDAGMYDGWTDHNITVKPSLEHDFILDVKGTDRNNIKEYICDTFNEVLSEEYEVNADMSLTRV